MRCQICTGCGLCPGVIAERDGRRLRILGGEESGVISDMPGTVTCPEGYRLIAADIGTTTIAMELYGKEGKVADRYVTVNPQVEFGRDVISRIQAAADPEKKKKLQDDVKSALSMGGKRFLKCLKAGEQPLMVIAANTTMSYLLMGWDCHELGTAPFAAGQLSGAQFFLKLEEGRIPCLLLPGISAFVGGDIYAGICACGMHEKRERTLLVDLGTNGEIALGSREGILCTATAAGPAFEGGPNRGIWGADLVRYTAMLLEEGILDGTGLLREPYFRTGIRIGNVEITQESVRSLQLAKAAIAAGAEILIKEAGITPDQIGQVVLAGGFGYYLHPEDAVRIGMLPEQFLGRTVSGGNTALLGAKRIGLELLQNAANHVGPELLQNAANHVGPELLQNAVSHAGREKGERTEVSHAGREKGAQTELEKKLQWSIDAALQADRGGLLKALPKVRTINLAQHPDFSAAYLNAMEL